MLMIIGRAVRDNEWSLWFAVATMLGLTAFWISRSSLVVALKTNPAKEPQLSSMWL